MFKFGKTYYWKGIRDTGQKVQGSYFTGKIAAVRQRLRSQGILVTQITRRQTLQWISQKITQVELLQVTHQLSRLLHSDISFIHAFSLLQEQYFSNVPMYELLTNIKIDLESGLGISASLKKHPRYFSKLYCNLVHVSEQCGNLAEQLLILAQYEERLMAMKKKVYQAVYYPILLLCTACLTSIALIVFIVPQFEQLFSEVGVALPWVTQLLIKISHGLTPSASKLIIFGVTMSALSFLLFNQFFRTIFSKLCHDLLFKLPWISSFIQSLELMRFTHTLSIMLRAGIFMVDALAASVETAHFSYYKIAILKARHDIILGVPLDQALANTNCFPKLMLQTIATSQVSGQLEHHLDKLSKTFSVQIDEKMTRMIAFLEPALLFLMGFVIGGIMLALYWPIFDLGHVITFT